MRDLRSGSKSLSVKQIFPFPQNYPNLIDSDTVVTGIMIQVSEVNKWLEHVNGKRDFPEENNLTDFFISHSYVDLVMTSFIMLLFCRPKKKPFLGAGKWIRGESFQTNYKWDAQKGISYHAFKT